jgi:DNA-binding LacI/PurR family transcriptional regulator
MLAQKPNLSSVSIVCSFAKDASMATIYEVAERAGVSAATISKVLSGKGYVSSTTRERVFRAINELGYVPSARARALSAGRSFIVGLLVPYSSEQFFDDPHLLTIMRGVERVANEHDYNLLLSTVRGSTDCARLLRSSVIDGAIVIENEDNPLFVSALGTQAYPWVAVGYPSAAAAAVVHADDRSGARALTTHLLAQGHRRIGLIDSSPRPHALAERLLGVAEALASFELSLDALPIVTGDFSEHSGYLAAQQLLRAPHPPSAMFALNDRMALGALRAAQERGVRVPEQLSVAGFDDIPAAATSLPPLTTVRQPGEALGVAAAHILFALLDGASHPAQQIIPAELVVRASTAPVV